MALKPYEDILIIQTAFIGDVLLSIPLFKKVRALWPQARLSVLVRAGLGEFVTRTGLIDHVYEVDKAQPDAWTQTTKALRARRWGLVLSPHRSPRTLLLVRSLSADDKIGYRSFFAKFVFDKTVARDSGLPEALRQLALLGEFDDALAAAFNAYAELEAPGRHTTGAKPGVAVTHLPAVGRNIDMSLAHFLDARLAWAQERSARTLSPRVQDLIAHEKLGAQQTLVLLAPGSVWNTKRWTADGYAQAARQLISEGRRVFLIGAPGEKELCEAIAARAPGTLSLAGRLSLWESAELISIADRLVANDSGAMHMASLSLTPTVAVFGPTVLAQGYRPWQTKALVVEANLACRPCGRHGARRCPLGTHACMKAVSVEDVLRAARAPELADDDVRPAR